MLVRPGPGLDICGSSSASIGIEPLDMVVDSLWSTTPLSISSTDELSYFTFVDEIPSTLDPCLTTIVPDLPHTPSSSRIWPNPVIDVLHVQGVGIDHIELLDAMGRSIRSEPRDHETSFDLDLHGLASGSYSVRILSGTGRESHVLIKD
jgi:hypothetical protein